MNLDGLDVHAGELKQHFDKDYSDVGCGFWS